MAKKKSSKKSPQQALQDADLKHYIDTERYVKQVQAIYGKAIADLAALAVRIDGIPEDKPFEWKHNPAIAKEVGEVVHKLADRITAAVETGSRREWTAACVKSEQFVASIMKLSKLPEKTLQGYQDRNLAALDAFTQREVDGMNLSARVWRHVSSLQDEVEVIVDTTGQYKNHAINSVAAKTKMESAIGTGMSAQELSREIRTCLVEPNKLFRRVRDKYGNLHLSKAAKLYHPGQGVYRSSYKNAMRLTRSEINMAYRQSDHLRWQQLDFVTGMKIQLSNNHTCLGADGKPHPFYDICDELAGDYPKDFKFVGWHPQCRCYATPILRPYDEMMEEREHIDEKGYKQMPASNEVKDPPKAFNDYITENAERIAGWKSTPYYIKDNPHWIDKALHPEKYVVQSLVLNQEQQKILEEYRMYAYNHQGSKKFAQALDDALKAQLAGDLEAFEKAMKTMFETRKTNERIAALMAKKKAAASIDPKQKALDDDFATFTPEQQKNIRELEKALGQKKGLKMTFEQADTGRENPHYADYSKAKTYVKDANGNMVKNPDKPKLEGYTINCQTCTLVHEMRRRGFNVEAIDNYRRKVWKIYEKNGVGSKARGYRVGKWLDSNGKPVGPTYAYEWALRNKTKIKTKEDVLKFFESFSGGNDGRYEIYIDWNKSSAHVFCAERKNGVWKFFDPQTGKKDVFDGYAKTASKLLDKIGIIRTDDKLINPKLIQTFIAKGELPIVTQTDLQRRAERIKAAAEKRHKARTKEKEEQLRQFAAEHKKKTEDAYQAFRDLMQEAGDIREADISRLMHLMYSREGNITTSAGVKVKASLERMEKEAEILKKVVKEYNNLKKIVNHLAPELGGIKDIDMSIALSSKSISELRTEIKKLQEARSKIFSLTNIDDPLAVAKQFGMQEAINVDAAVAKKIAYIEGLTPPPFFSGTKLEFQAKKLKFEAYDYLGANMVNCQAKCPTWQVAQKAYIKKLQAVEAAIEVEKTQAGIDELLVYLGSHKAPSIKSFVTKAQDLLAKGEIASAKKHLIAAQARKAINDARVAARKVPKKSSDYITTGTIDDIVPEWKNYPGLTETEARKIFVREMSEIQSARKRLNDAGFGSWLKGKLRGCTPERLSWDYAGTQAKRIIDNYYQATPEALLERDIYLRVITSKSSQLQGKVKGGCEGHKFDKSEFTDAAKKKAKLARTGKEADDLLAPLSEEWWAKSDAEQHLMAYEYTHGSGFFNQTTYGSYGRVRYDIFGREMKDPWAGVDTFTELIDAAPGLKESMIVVRGESMDTFKAKFGIDLSTVTDLKSLVGRTGENVAFTSTAVRGGAGFSGDIQYEIYLPKGTKAIYAEPFSHFGSELGEREGYGWNGMSKRQLYGSEQELILQRGSVFRIVEVEDLGHGDYKVKVELIEQRAKKAGQP